MYLIFSIIAEKLSIIRKFSTLFIYLFLLFLLWGGSSGNAQNNDFEAGILNVGIGSVLGGVGAIINKEPNQKFGKTLLKGLGQGALGGYLVFESKRLIREFSETGDYNYIWPSKIVNSAGTSIIENAAANRDLWARWHLNIGFNRIEVDAKDNFRLSYRLLPANLVGTLFSFMNASFDPNMSIKTGSLVFRKTWILNGKYLGRTVGNNIILEDDYMGTLAISHELIHVHQNESFVGINPAVKKYVEKRYGSKSWYVQIKKIIYPDYNTVAFGIIYLMDSFGSEYYDNIFEEEAEYFADTVSRREAYGF